VYPRLERESRLAVDDVRANRSHVSCVPVELPVHGPVSDPVSGPFGCPHTRLS
jgi:hypothetical protein